jgi:hypothetical protein
MRAARADWKSAADDFTGVIRDRDTEIKQLKQTIYDNS